MKLLLDEHLWPGLVEMVSKLVPGHDLESVHSFDGGALVNQADSLILERARLEGRVLVTCDVNTIPEELRERAHAGKSHAGVVFLSSKSFCQRSLQNAPPVVTSKCTTFDREFLWFLGWVWQWDFCSPERRGAGNRGSLLGGLISAVRPDLLEGFFGLLRRRWRRGGGWRFGGGGNLGR